MVSYRVHGVPFGVRSDVADVLRRVDDTYAAFRAARVAGNELAVLGRGGSACVVTGGRAGAREWPDARSALCDVLGRIVDALPPADVARVLPGWLADPAPLSHVILLDGRPDPLRPPSLTPVAPGVAAMELMRSMPSAATDFGGALRRLGRLLPGASCARLRSGALEPTLDLVLGWTRAGG